MEDMKSYTVRVETGEIRLMSQEEVSKLVRTTLARAESGTPSTKKPTQFARSKGTYSTASDLSRRLSLSPRHLRSTGAFHFGKNPEEVPKSPTSKLFQDFRAAVATGALSTPPEESRDDNNNTSTERKISGMEESLRSREERFSSLVRTVGPTVIDPENDPRDVSFTVSTEVDGPKNLSEKELHALVRSSIIRAKFNARHKKSRRKLEFMVDNDSSMQSPDSSPTKRMSRKFSWSTVEKSDDEDFEDFRDDEKVEVSNYMNDTRQESEFKEQTSEDNQIAVDEMVNAEKNGLSTHGSEEIYISPCTSSKIDAVDFVEPKVLRNDDELKSPIRQSESDTQILSLVLSGGDASISDKHICNMVKHSMAKAKMTRQEISDLLEDTSSPSHGASKIDLTGMFDGTKRRAKDSSRVLGVKSLSPRHRRSLCLNTARVEVAPIHEPPSSVGMGSDPVDIKNMGNDDPVDTKMVQIVPPERTLGEKSISDELKLQKDDLPISTEFTLQKDDKTTSDEIVLENEELNASNKTLLDKEGSLNEIVLEKGENKMSAVSETAEFNAFKVSDGIDVSPLVGKQHAENTAGCPETDDEMLTVQGANVVTCHDLEMDGPVDDAAKIDNSDSVVLPEMDVQPVDDADQGMNPPAAIEEVSKNVVQTVPHQPQNNSCCFQLCCMPIILSSSSVEEKEKQERVSAAVLAVEPKLPEETIPFEEIPGLKFEDDCKAPVYEATKLTDQQHESTPLVHGQENVIDLTDVVSCPSGMAAPSAVAEAISPQNDVAHNDYVKALVQIDEVKKELDPFVDSVTKASMDGCDPQIINHVDHGAASDETKNPEELIPISPDGTIVDESPCMTCFHVPMNPEKVPVEDKTESFVEQKHLNEKYEGDKLIESEKVNSTCIDAQKESANVSPKSLNAFVTQEECINDQTSLSKMKRDKKGSKYRRFKDYYDVKTVITDEFISEVISRKGSIMSVSELAKILRGDTTKTIENVMKATSDNDSALHSNNSADETMQSNRSDIDEKVKATLQQGGFCMDFLSMFTDLDPGDIDDDFGSASLLPDDSRAVTWIESVADAYSKDETTDQGAAHSIYADDDKPPKTAEYESEFAASLDEKERRRLTFSFSEGRYTGSLSSVDDY